MQRQDYYFISVIALGLVFVMLWQFGTFSSNVKQENIGEEILKYVNQTYLMQHEDNARDIQDQKKDIKDEENRKFEQSGRDNQTKQFSIALSNLLGNFTAYIDKSNNTISKILQEIIKDEKQNIKILKALNQSQSNQANMLNLTHTAMGQNQDIIDRILRDHSTIQTKIGNTTNDIKNITTTIDLSLDKYGKNS